MNKIYCEYCKRVIGYGERAYRIGHFFIHYSCVYNNARDVFLTLLAPQYIEKFDPDDYAVKEPEPEIPQEWIDHENEILNSFMEANNKK